MHDSLTLCKSLLACPSLRCFDLFILGLHRSLILAAFPTIPIRHLLVAPTALVCRVKLFGHIGIRIRLEVFIEALVIFVSGATFHACSDDFFLGGVNISVVEGGLNKGGGLRKISIE